jgi:hypothetical protein
LLACVAELGVRLEAGWHAGDVIDHGADRIAGVGGREGAVQHVDALDFLRRDQAPARRESGAIAQVVGQQDAVGVHHRTGAVAGARSAGGQHGVVVVADEALAHQQAGQVFERVFAVGGVDGLLDLLGGDAFDGGWYLGWQRGGPAARDGDGAQHFEGRFLCPCIGGQDGNEGRDERRVAKFHADSLPRMGIQIAWRARRGGVKATESASDGSGPHCGRTKRR